MGLGTAAPASREPIRHDRQALSSREDHLSEHKFKIGQTVNFTSGPFGRGGTNGVYKITQLLPPEGDDRQYRIKSSNEPHERVVKESQLTRVA
jgi:hypothetical protein